MKTTPIELLQRSDLNLRLGIKSSLCNLKSIVALLYILYVASNRKAKVEYSEEYQDNHGLTRIRLNKALEANIKQYLAIDNIGDLDLAHNSLFTAQIEHLQVFVELFLKLGKINLISVANGINDASERVGGNRYKKAISFGTNIQIIDLYLTAISQESVRTYLLKWIKNDDSNLPVNNGIKQLLTIFSEDTQFKIRTNDKEIVFQQEGIYKAIEHGDTVINQDARENVGPFRIYKSYIKEGLHPYIQDGNNGFESKNMDVSTLEYFKLVSNSLDLIPKRTTIITDTSATPAQKVANADDNEWQKIVYGCPGTGKSYKLKKEYTDGVSHEFVFRTTFHPDSDYASFVGCYKPISLDGNISYEFTPQVFANAYISAWENPGQVIYLIIEEINRGNCAQIFGDLFQLLDRNDDGTSTYKIKADCDLCKYLEVRLGDSLGIKDGEISLPSNLHILATMNTSDQSLFPLDSAFKRRWAWEHIPIDYSEEIESGKFTISIGDAKYKWIEFLKKANERILKATTSEDKQMGNFFIKKDIKEHEFVNKVMFYVWSEVCKDEYQTQQNFFRTEVGEFSFSDLFKPNANQILIDFMTYLGVNKITIDEQPEE